MRETIKKETNTNADKKQNVQTIYIKKICSKKLMQSHITHHFLSVQATKNVRRFIHFANLLYYIHENDKLKHKVRKRHFHFQTSLTIYHGQENMYIDLHILISTYQTLYSYIHRNG